MTNLKTLFAPGLLFLASMVVSPIALALPLGGVVENLPGANEEAIRNQADSQMRNKATRFRSTQVETEVFEGVFVPASNATKLAVVSDDGVTIKIDEARTNVNNLGKNQDDNYISRTLKVLNKTFVAGRAYRIKVEYSNTIHENAADFDGMTLFAYNGGGIVQEVNLIISRGQGGYAVPDDDEETVGSFTVANLNNTDSDAATADNADNDVPGEKDLMALEISRPAGDATARLSVKVIAGAARLWTQATKGTQAPEEFTLGELPKTIYVEATGTSQALRDISVELDYNGQKDLVKATGIWAEVTAVASENKSADDLFADETWQNTPDGLKIRIRAYGGTGVRPLDPQNGFRNVILTRLATYARFTVEFRILKIKTPLWGKKSPKTASKCDFGENKIRFLANFE